MIKRPSKNFSLYINYPTEERLNLLRERVKTWNEIDKIKEQRLLKVAKPEEVVAYLMGDVEKASEIDARWAEVTKRKAKFKKEPVNVIPKENTEPITECFKFPQYVQDVLDGDRYPDIYDCTKEEQIILYNRRFLELFHQYRTAKSELSAKITMNEITDLVKGLLK